MKFDKETGIVIALSMAILLGWAVFYPKWQAKSEEAAKQQQIVEAEASRNAAQIVSAPAPVKNVATATGSVPSALPAQQSPKTVLGQARPNAYSIASRYAQYFFHSNGAMDEIMLRNHKITGEDKSIKVPEAAGFEPLSFAIPGMELRSVRITKKSDAELIVTKIFSGTSKVTAVQTFTATDRANFLQSRIQLSSDAKTDLVIPRMIVWGGTLAPLKQMTNDDLRDIHMLEYCYAGSRKVVTVDPSAKPEKFQQGVTNKPLEWVAVSNKYFISLLAGKPVFNGGCELVNPTVWPNTKDSYKLPGIAGVYDSIAIPAGKTFDVQLDFYLGPKILSDMQGLPASTGDAIHLAYWSWLEPLCRPMLYLLNALKDLTGSYGLAIILLTVLVKLVLWPLIHKGNKSMRRLQRVQPLVKELKEKYKENQQEFSRQMMELYKKEKVSPFGGCFPMLLQLPVFIALYSTLDSSVELRHVSFLWAQDLSRPDLVGPTFMGIGLHPFIIISTLLMVVQQKLTPPMSDPMQQKMMMFMPVIMLFFFYSFPSGLALYWTVNNVLSILQMKFSQYVANKEELELNKSAEKQKI